MIKHLCLVFALLVLAGCSGGGSDAPASLAPKPENQLPGQQPPAPASLIWSTPSGLFRSRTDGSGQVTLAQEPAGIWSVLVSGTNVVYMTPQVPAVVNHEDLWAVQTNGTNRHRLVHDPEHETHLRDVIGSWVLYDYRPGRSFEPPPPSLASILLTGEASRIIMAAEGAGELWQSPNYQRRAGGRAILEFAGNLFSLLPDGTDLRQLTTYPPFPHLDNEPFTVVLGTSGVVGDRIIYGTLRSPSSPISAEGTPKLFAVPVLGGPVVKLGTGPEYEILGAVVGTRVVYNRCTLVALPDFEFSIDHCDVSSVRGNGQERIALTDTPDINYVQGAIGEQVIIRRSQRGGTTDHLVSIPVNGGEETLLLTLSWDEFVMGIVDDRIIVQRPSGIWSLKADGSGLVRLTAEAERFTFGAAGPFTCFARGSALWCVPADGSAQPTQVAENGTFVEGL